MIKKIFVLIGLFLISSVAFADITSISDSLSDRATITLSGSGFGTRTDNGGSESYMNYKWDDYESGNLFDTYETTDAISIDTGNSRAGSTYCIARSYTDNTDHCIRVSSSSSNDGYYSSFWAKVPTSINWGDYGQIKFVRIYNDNQYPNFTMSKHEYLGGSDRSFNAVVEAGTSSTAFSSGGFQDVDIFDDNGWHRFEVWFKPSSGIGNTDGEITVWMDGTIYYSSTAVTTANGTHNTFNEKWWLGGYMTYSDGDFYLDDAYMDYTQARVELGNASTFSACTHREIQIPTAWSTSSITIDVNTGSFTTGETAYLFVVDSDGVASTGYEVTIDGTGSTPTPTPSNTNTIFDINNATFKLHNAQLQITEN